MGLFDGLFSDDPQKQALLMMGLGLLQGAPQGKKNFGADLAHGGLMGMQGYNQANVLQTRKREEDQQREMRAMQMEQMKRQNEMQGKKDALAGQFFGPAGFQPQNDDQGNAMPPVPMKQDFGGYAQALMGVDPTAGLDLQSRIAQMQAKERVKFKPGETIGTYKGDKFVPDYTAPDKPHWVDAGDSVIPVDNTGKPLGPPIKKNAGPEAMLSAETQRRGQNMTDARSREMASITREGQQTQILDTPNGPIAVNKGTAVSRPVMDQTGTPIRGEAQQKREIGAKNVLDLLNDAEKILPNATNSYAGAATDFAARGVGAATGGAKAIASLKTIEGALLSQMPRMEGPQSNYDVQMYKEAAGRLGDPTIPRELKQEAINAIRNIQERYAGAARPNGASGRIRAYNPSTGKIE